MTVGEPTASLPLAHPASAQYHDENSRSLSDYAAAGLERHVGVPKVEQGEGAGPVGAERSR
jgi:hypothetical protein